MTTRQDQAPSHRPSGEVRGVLGVATEGRGGEAQPETTTGPAMTAGPAQASAVSEAGSSVKDGSTVPQAIPSVEELIGWERRLRAEQAHHQAEVDDYGAWRQRVIQCLHNVHGLSYKNIAERLGDVTASRVQQIARGKAR